MAAGAWERVAADMIGERSAWAKSGCMDAAPAKTPAVFRNSRRFINCSEFKAADFAFCPVRKIKAAEAAEIYYIFQSIAQGIFPGLYSKQIRPLYILHPEGSSHISLDGGNFNVTEFHIAGMPYKKSSRRQYTEHGGFGVTVLFLRRIERGPLFCASAQLLKVNVRNLHVFDAAARNAADD